METQGSGGGIGSGAPPATNMEAVVGVAGFAIGWVMGAGAFTTLDQHWHGNSLHMLVGLVLMGLQWMEEAKSMEEVGPPNGMGAIMGGGGKFRCGGYGIGFIP